MFLGTGVAIPFPRNTNIHKPGKVCGLCSVWLFFSKNNGFKYDLNRMQVLKIIYIGPKWQILLMLLLKLMNFRDIAEFTNPLQDNLLCRMQHG